MDDHLEMDYEDRYSCDYDGNNGAMTSDEYYDWYGYDD